MLRVSITIPAVGGKPAWSYSQEVNVPRVVEEIVIPKPSKVELDIIKQAFNGQEITVIAGVLSEGKVSSGKEAQLIIDNEVVQSKNTRAGLVDFKWVADPGIHTLCVKSSGVQDCAQISVSSSVPEIYERLKIEREAYKESRKKLEERRKKIREEIPALIKGTGRVSIPSLPEAYWNMPIMLDGRTVGKTPKTGEELLLPDIKPGDHVIIIQPPNAPPIRIPVVVEPGETIKIILPEGM